MTHFPSALCLIFVLSSPLLAVFVPGSIDGQEGWNGGAGNSINLTVNQFVTASEGLTPNGAFSFSNSGALSGGFAGWVYSPSLGATTAGQPSSGANGDSMNVTFWFKSVSSAADGTNMEFDYATSSGPDRNTVFNITNDTDGAGPANGGLKIRYSGSNSSGFTSEVILATDIARNTWNKIEMVFTGIDGITNDSLTILLNDNTIVSSATTAEGYRESLPAAYQTVNGILMRSGRKASVVGPFDDTTSPQGILVDDLSFRIYNSFAPGVTLGSYATDFTVVPEPATWAALAGLGVLGFAFWKRRRV